MVDKGKYVCIGKEDDGVRMRVDRGMEVMKEKGEGEEKGDVKVLDEEDKMEIVNGKYGG